MSNQQLEEGRVLTLDFEKLQKVAKTGVAVLPVAVQDVDSKAVLIVAYANEVALNYTLKHGIAAFWSTSRNELWVKGAGSGNTLAVSEVRVNCEQNSLLYLVRLQNAGACHTQDEDGNPRQGCYYRRISQTETTEGSALALTFVENRA